jgi:ligand-binding sensor domain-containing protein
MRGLVRFDGTLWQSFETSSSALPGPYMNAIADDREGNVWISCHSDWYDQGGGLVKVTGSVWKIFDRTSAPYAVTDISDMKFDWDNVLWATSFYCGLLRFDGSRWTNFTPSNSKLPQAHLRCLSLDIRGRVWIGTYGNGIVQFDGRTWTTYDLVSRGAASNDVRSIEAGRSDGMVWIGTTCGLVKFDASGRLSVFNSKNTPLPHDTINVIRFDNKGVLWVGTEGAIASYDGRSWRVVRLPQGDGWWSDVTDIRFEPSGLIWVGTRGEGLLSYNGFGWTHFDYRTSPFPGDMVYTITIDKNQNKWIGSWNGMAIYRSWGVQVSVDTSRTTRLLHPFPSPFNDATRIVFSVAQPAHAQLNVFNLLGQKVKTLVNGELLAGQHALLWDGTNESGERVATGAYFCRLQIGDFSAVKRVVMVR